MSRLPTRRARSGGSSAGSRGSPGSPRVMGGLRTWRHSSWRRPKESKGKKPARSPEQKALAMTLKANTTNLAKARALAGNWRIKLQAYSRPPDRPAEDRPRQETRQRQSRAQTASPEWCRHESPISQVAAPNRCSKASWRVRRWRRNGRVPTRQPSPVR
jgi:hypothetical protein